MLRLRPYQQRTVDEIHRMPPLSRVCVQSPTGSGKGVMLAKRLMSGRPAIVLSHRRVLLDQLSRVLTAHNIDHGIRAAGVQPNPKAPVQIAMAQTEYSRVFKRKDWPLHPCVEAHVDEMHALKAATAEEILKAYHAQGASVYGWTATPKELIHLVDRVIVSATPPELIQDGYLVPPSVFTPDGPDARKLESVGRQANGEYNRAELEKVWRAKAIFGRVLEHYQRLNPVRRPTLGFAPGVAESKWYAQRFTHHGIPAAHIASKEIWYEGESRPNNTEERETLFRRVRGGELVLWNRFVMREGVDIPEIEHVILACVIGSRSAFVQAAGRGLRPAPGKACCTFQDHGGNHWRFPPLDSDELWDITVSERELERRRIERLRKQASEPGPNSPELEPIVCPQCAALRASGDECPVCGHRHTARTRPVIEINGQLKHVSGPLYPARQEAKGGDLQRRWDRQFFAAKKHKPTRTFRQLRAFDSRLHGWRWLPTTLERMPLEPDDWGARVGELPLERLR